MLDIYVDADGCPVKDETYKVARRYGLSVYVVANGGFVVPREDWIHRVVVGGDPDAADDWIVEHLTEGDIVITPDLPLAQRSLAAGARVITPRGRIHDQDSIGAALARRDLNAYLRELGEMTDGPPPFGPRQRSRFLQSLDEVIQRQRRAGGGA